MKKRIIALLLAAAALCMSGCGNSEAEKMQERIGKQLEKAVSEQNARKENKPYTEIPTGTYYEDNQNKTGVEMAYYISDPELESDDVVAVSLYSDGTGVFWHSVNYAIVEKGSLTATSEGAVCKYNSGKQVTLTSFGPAKDMSYMEFSVIVDDQLKNYTCYLYTFS